MSLPSFPEDSSSPVLVDFPMRGGTGDHLPVWLLACCGAFTAVGECEAAFRSGLADTQRASMASYRAVHEGKRRWADGTLTLSL